MQEDQTTAPMTIALEGIELFAYHGVYERERIEGNPYIVDIYINTPLLPATQSDQLADTLDYQHVYKLIVDIMEQPVNLLEHLVSKIGQRLLAEFSLIRKVKVRVAKVKPLAMAHCRQTFVEMDFHQEG
ncbi:MAG: dihydroneopterin aldolase [Bacteroidota bacterium]